MLFHGSLLFSVHSILLQIFIHCHKEPSKIIFVFSKLSFNLAFSPNFSTRAVAYDTWLTSLRIITESSAYWDILKVFFFCLFVFFSDHCMIVCSRLCLYQLVVLQLIFQLQI